MTKQNIIQALPEIILNRTEGFLQKGFKWKDIPMLSVITGVNGSGKTQLLDWIWKNKKYSGSHFRTNQILYKKSNGDFCNAFEDFADYLDYFANYIFDKLKKIKSVDDIFDNQLYRTFILGLHKKNQIKNDDLILFKQFSTRSDYVNFFKNNISNSDQKNDFIKKLDEYAEKLYKEAVNIKTCDEVYGNIFFQYLMTSFIGSQTQFLIGDLDIEVVLNQIHQLNNRDDWLSFFQQNLKGLQESPTAQIFKILENLLVEFQIEALKSAQEDIINFNFIDKITKSNGLYKVNNIDAINKASNITRSINKIFTDLQEKYPEVKFLKNACSSSLKMGEFQLKFKNTNNESNLIDIDYDQLSNGEKVIFELICYKYILEQEELAKSQPKIVLLDEFDAHLNPSLARVFMDVIQNQFCENGIQVIMTTHSPSTAAYTREENLFWMEDGKILWEQDRKEKMDIVHRLATGFTIANSDPFMSYLIDPNKPYFVITEGYYDILHLKTACKKLGGDYEKIINECNFIHMNGANDPEACELFTTKCYEAFIKNFNGRNSKAIIVVLDNDKSGNEVAKKLNQRFKAEENFSTIVLKASQAEPYKANYQNQINYKYLPIELLYEKVLVEKYFDFSMCDSAERHAKKYYFEYQNAANKEGLVYLKEKEPSKSKGDFAKVAQDFEESAFEYFKPTLDLIVEKIEN